MVADQNISRSQDALADGVLDRTLAFAKRVGSALNRRLGA